MAKTALDLKPHERQAYKPDKIFKLRTVEEERKIKTRRQNSWDLARKAANLLKSDFGAEKVLVFGSLFCMYRALLCGQILIYLPRESL